MAPRDLSEPARLFLRSLAALKRASAEDDLGAILEGEAMRAAAKLLGLEPLRAHNYRRRRGRRKPKGPPIDYPVAARELERAGLVALAPQPEPAEVRRACPQCGAGIHWLVTRAGLEAPWCRDHGALRFWLVFDRARPVGYGGFGGASLW